MASAGYAAGDKVEIKPSKKGQIICVVDGGTGNAKHFAAGKWYGVRLTEKKGTCDGRYKGKDPYFFKCPQGFGVFVQAKLIIKKIADNFDFMNETQQIEEEEQKDNLKYKTQKDKIKKLKAKFKEIDVDGSKTLQQDEFIPLAVSELGCDNAAAIKLFKDIDASGNGSVSFAEFDSWLKAGGGIDKLLTYGKLKQAFKDADKDGNMTLSLDEFVKLGATAMNLAQPHATTLFKQIDANDNGSVCFSEFEAYVDDLGGMDNFKVYSQVIAEFKAADNDNSGGLELVEFQKLLKDKLKINKFKAARIFRSIDKDGNDTVSLVEFTAWVNKIGGVKRIKT